MTALQPPAPAGHRTAVGHIPAARVVSWGCTCGHGEVLDYADSTPAGWAMAVARGRAAHHRSLIDNLETPCNPE